MPRRKRPVKCLCGCGQMTKGSGKWMTGHNSEFLSKIIEDAGGTIKLREIVDEYLLGGGR